jgi:hypothetical protein
MATISEKDGVHRIQADASDDVQVVTITREEARKYFDEATLPEAFETALDLIQAEAESQRAILILVVAQEPTAA